MAIFWTIQHFENVTSTQDIAKQNLYEGLIVQANEQTAGRGRHGREWISQPGNLFFSFVIKPECKPDQYGQIALKVGLALAKAVGQGALLKWPNDVLIEGQKCAGILIEAEEGYLVIGIGVNTAYAPQEAYCLHVENDDLRDSFFSYFDQFYEMDFKKVKEEWLSLTYPLGYIMGVKVGNKLQEGQFEGIDDQGNLLLSGQVIHSGEVIL